VIIDCDKSRREKEEFKRRYSFVDWKCAVAYFDGFDNRGLEFDFLSMVGQRGANGVMGSGVTHDILAE
jgi:hypothetical protein